MAGVQRVKLNNLNINLKNALIIGIIIAKSSYRKIGSKKKNGDSRAVMSFTLRDSSIDTINVDVWGSEYFVITFYERFLVGDMVEVSSPKICIKSGDNELYRPQVSSPFYLSLNEGMSDVGMFTGDAVNMYLPLLHIPSKPSSGYCGLAEVMKFQETENVYVDLLVVVKTVKPVKTITTKAGTEMSVRSVEIMDNTTPAAILLDIFDIDTIKRAQEWLPLESVLFIADARVSFRGRSLTLQVCSRCVVTHQPHTPDAEALRLYIRNQTNTRGWEAGAWASWSGERASAASVAQIRDRLAESAPFCAALHALLTHLDLDDLSKNTSRETYRREVVELADQVPLGPDRVVMWGSLPAMLPTKPAMNPTYHHTFRLTDFNAEELRVRFADHTGELGAYIPITVLEDALGLSADQLKSMSADDRAVIRWKLLLEPCSAKLAVTPPRIIVLTIRRASAADPIPLY